MKIQKTGSVSTDGSECVHGLTPGFSALPGVLDLRNGERAIRVVRGERYLIGERQEIIIVIEELQGPRIILGEGVTGEIFDSAAIPHTLVAILRKAVTKLGSCKGG